MVQVATMTTARTPDKDPFDWLVTQETKPNTLTTTFALSLSRQTMHSIAMHQWLSTRRTRFTNPIKYSTPEKKTRIRLIHVMEYNGCSNNNNMTYVVDC
jgi:hypothetical protein